MVARVISANPHDQAIDADDCLKQCFAYGQQAYRQRRISSKASIGKLLFQNGFKLMENRDLVSAGGPELTEQRVRAAEDLREILLRLHKIQALSLPE